MLLWIPWWNSWKPREFWKAISLKIFIDKVEIAVRDFLSNHKKYDIEDYDWCLDTIMVNEGAIVEQEPHTDFPRCEHDKKQML